MLWVAAAQIGRVCSGRERSLIHFAGQRVCPTRVGRPIRCRQSGIRSIMSEICERTGRRRFVGPIASQRNVQITVEWRVRFKSTFVVTDDAERRKRIQPGQHRFIRFRNLVRIFRAVVVDVIVVLIIVRVTVLQSIVL